MRRTGFLSLFSKYRKLSHSQACDLRRPLLSSSHRLLSPSKPFSSVALFVNFPTSKSFSPPPRLLPPLAFRSPFPAFDGWIGLQVRHFADEAPSGKKTKSKIQRKAKSRHFKKKKKAERSRAPMTPIISKVKKYKLKSYSSYKFRFRTLNDGTIRHWSAKGHHHSKKSKQALRRLRKPKILHAAYAKVMKKLNFCG